MTLQVGFLLFPDVQQLDLTGPFEVFASLSHAHIRLVAATMEQVISATGLVLTPTDTFDGCPQLDVLCVPGGRGVNPLLVDPQTLAFVRHQAERVQYLTSVCTGALVLGAAGLLQGKRATTHWIALDLLMQFGATPIKARVVRDGNLITGGGVTAGIDFALTLAAELAGEDIAKMIQLGLEYSPSPPFNSGLPELAAPAIVDAVLLRSASMRAEREHFVNVAAALL